MIIVVEGPSAAGKSTWALEHAGGSLVPEHTGLHAPSGDHDAVVSFWVVANGERWEQALRVEASTGTAVCDTDPLKLHYDFCLMRIGQRSMTAVRAGAAACRAAIAEQRLGIADLVLCLVPDAETLEQRRDADDTRSRRNFDLHRQLGAPLTEWYDALARLDPGRVQWDFPDALPAVVERDRYDLELFDAWMRRLGIT